ncbi:spore coat protein, partial [Planococcus sp. SIMBA_143]
QMGSNNQNVAGAYEGYGSKANSGGYPGEVAGAYGYSNQNVAGAYEGFGNKGNGYPGAVAGAEMNGYGQKGEESVAGAYQQNGYP